MLSIDSLVYFKFVIMKQRYIHIIIPINYNVYELIKLFSSIPTCYILPYIYDIHDTPHHFH